MATLTKPRVSNISASAKPCWMRSPGGRGSTGFVVTEGRREVQKADGYGRQLATGAASEAAQASQAAMASWGAARGEVATAAVAGSLDDVACCQGRPFCDESQALDGAVVVWAGWVDGLGRPWSVLVSPALCRIPCVVLTPESAIAVASWQLQVRRSPALRGADLRSGNGLVTRAA